MAIKDGIKLGIGITIGRALVGTIAKFILGVVGDEKSEEKKTEE